MANPKILDNSLLKSKVKNRMSPRLKSGWAICLALPGRCF